jgi:3-deoxy-7-phosphoheptulonate synthase
LKHLAEAREQTGLPIITEVMGSEDIGLVGEYTDIFQVRARNTQNYSLLKALGKQSKPVFLKRGISGTVQELLISAEYILSGGNMKVMVCDAGIRTYETATRNTFDINAIPVLKEQSHLPVIGDPAHGTGMWQLVGAVAKAAVAAGADGLMVEVHPDPARAWSDGTQSLTLKRFSRLMQELRQVAQAVGRDLSTCRHGQATQRVFGCCGRVGADGRSLCMDLKEGQRCREVPRVARRTRTVLDAFSQAPSIWRPTICRAGVLGADTGRPGHTGAYGFCPRSPRLANGCGRALW